MLFSARHRQHDDRPHGIVWKRVLACLFCFACYGTLGRDIARLSAPPSLLSSKPERLEVGKSLQRSLASNESHSYELPLTAGEYFHVRFNFYGLDAAVRLIAPDGGIVEELWSPDRRIYSRIRFMLVAQQAGVYRLEVRLVDAATSPQRKRQVERPDRRQYYGSDLGTYNVTLQEKRPAVLPADQFRGLAERAFLQGWRLRSEGSLPSVRQALEKFTEALPYWKASGDPFDEAYTLTFEGEAFQQISEYSLAVATFEKALAVWQSVGDPSMGEPWTLSDLGSVFAITGDREKSLQYYQRALDIYSSNGDARGKGICLTAIGGIYASWGEKQKALAFLRRALPNWMAANVTDSLGQAQALNRMGGVLVSLGDAPGAARFHQRALELAIEFGADYLQAESLHHLAQAHLSANARQDAITCAQHAEDIQEKIGDRRGQATSLSLLGTIHHSEGRLEQALDHQKRALRFSLEIGDRTGEALARGSLAVTLADGGDRIRAAEELQRALTLHLQTGDREGEAATRYHLARLDNENGRASRAVDHIRRAMEIVEEIRIRVASLELRSLYLASVHEYYELYRDILMQLHRMDSAAGYAEAAFVVNERAKARGLLDALDEVGVAVRQNAEPSLLNRERWLQQVINEKARLRSQAALANNVAEVTGLAKQIEELSLQLREVQETLRAKSSRFAQLTQVPLVNVEKLQKEILDSDSVLLEFGLGEPHSYLWAVTSASFTSHELPSRRQIEKTSEWFHNLVSGALRESPSPPGKLGAAKPNEGLLRRHDDSPNTLQAAATWLSQTLLGPVASQIQGKRLIIIADGALQYLPFAALPMPAPSVKNESAALVSTQVESSVQSTGFSLLGSLKAGLKTRSSPANATVTCCQQASGFDHIRSNSLSRLWGEGGLSDGGRDGRVRGSRPAEALSSSFLTSLASSGADTNAAAQRRSDAVWTPLIEGHDIIHLPSASSLLPLRQQLSRRQPAPKLVVVLADPVFDDADPRVEKTKALRRVGRSGSDGTQFASEPATTQQQNGVDGLPGDLYRTLEENGTADSPGKLSRLIFSRQEANAILSCADPRQSRKALDFEASRALAVSGELGQYRIVHFATHGFVDRTTPDLSGIVFSLVNHRGQPQDGFLRLHDIYRLQLPADLVVLSACNTALGKNIRGEGLIALTRGFMVAGAARVVASLWKVDDRATAEFMKHFYSAMLREGLPPATALRSAQRALWRQERWREPRYWAAFQIQGEWR
jgi:CHAT domain-containing protein/tetratricopeptide (TPR) repeat protein